jgi:ABC-2 type transport system permease protein
MVSLTESQVVAAGGARPPALWAVSERGRHQPAPLRIAAQLAMFDHFEPFARGVIDAGDLAYFAAATALFVFLTLRVLEARHWRGRR